MRSVRTSKVWGLGPSAGVLCALAMLQIQLAVYILSSTRRDTRTSGVLL